MFFQSKQLTVGYQGVPLIRDINLSLEKGKILTLIGPNGSGKSTILKTLSKHLGQISGVVTLDAKNIARWSNMALAKRLSVMLTERVDPELMTCGEVVEMGRYPYTKHFGRLTEADKAVVDKALLQVRAKELVDRPFCDISDGQRQRILLARAICQAPEVLVLDEPTSYLDIRHKIELLDILKDMARKEQVAILMSLHEIDLAAKISDWVICVKGDTIERCGPPDAIFSDASIRALYGMEQGAYNSRFGSVELSAPKGRAELFVLGGGGVGLHGYRLLQKHSCPFVTGILYEHDVDFEVAQALAAKTVHLKPFCPMTEKELAEGKALIDQVDCFLNEGVPLGPHNALEAVLIDYAHAQGKRIFSSVEAFLEDRNKESKAAGIA